MTTRRIELQRQNRLRRNGGIPDHPVLLPEATARWPALRRWTPDYFTDRVGHRRVTVDGEDYTVRELLERIDRSTAEDPAPYLRAQKLAEVFPELSGDLEPMIDDARPNWTESRLLPPSIRRGRLRDPARRSGCRVPRPALRQGPRARLHQSALRAQGPWHTTLMSQTSISVTWNMVEASNWDAFAADTRLRVSERTHPVLAAAFGVYAALFGMAARRLNGAVRMR